MHVISAIYDFILHTQSARNAHKIRKHVCPSHKTIGRAIGERQIRSDFAIGEIVKMALLVIIALGVLFVHR